MVTNVFFRDIIHVNLLFVANCAKYRANEGVKKSAVVYKRDES